VTAPKRRILGISDSTSLFAPVWREPVLMRKIAELTGVTGPVIYYIGAANGDDPRKIGDFTELARRVGAQPEVFRVFAMTCQNPGAYFRGADAIFIDGGSTRNLLALLREWDAVEPLFDAYRRGVLLAGASAGISCLFDWCISDSILTQLTPVRGLGILAGTVCAHYDARPDRQAALLRLIDDDPNALPAYGLEEGVAALFVDERFVESYTNRPGGRLHIVERGSDAGLPRGIRLNDVPASLLEA